jgi:hypothetical protein
MTARYRSTCPACRRKILPGAEIRKAPALGAYVHADCPVGRGAGDSFDMAVEDQMARACGINPYGPPERD